MSVFSSDSNDVFRTQADQRFNSFSDPLNPVNTTPGAWGIDPYYLTPPNLSPFRPRYQGPTGDNYSRFRPNWFSSVNQVFNPLAGGGDNYGGNYWNQTTPFYDSLLTKPTQGVMSFAQNWAVPAAMGYAGFKALGGASTRFGEGLGAGLASKMFASAGPPSKLGMMAVRGSSFMGGLAAGIALPAMAVQGGVAAADKMLFDPFIAQSNSRNNIRENFRGISYGQGEGDPFTGGGFSRESASRLAKNISTTGALDRTFTQHETATLADYAMRSGLMDNVMPDQMSKKFDNVIKQVKMVMSVANTSDFRETIEIMSKLRMAGISDKQLPATLATLSAAAGGAGQSLQKMLNTVGAQGQYMFGGAGLTPYVGHEVAFNTNAAMSAAYRSGMLSPALAARMGGVEGAAQSALAGSIALAKTPYAGFQAYNAYMGSGETGNFVSNMSRFGGSMAQNPLQNIGRFMMGKDAMTSRALQDRGLLGEQDQLMQFARTLNPNMIQSNGKIDAGTAYMLFMSMGLTQEQAMAKIQEFASYNDSGAVGSRLAGSKTASTNAILDYQRQQGLNKGFMTKPYQAVTGAAYSAQKRAARMVGTMGEGVGRVSDSFQKYWNEHFFRLGEGEQVEGEFEDENALGNTDRMKINQADLSASGEAKLMLSAVTGAFKNFKANPGDNVFNILTQPGLNMASNMADIAYHENDLKRLNKLAKDKSSPLQNDAATILDPSADMAKKKAAIMKLSTKGQISKEYTDDKEANKFLDSLSVFGTVSTDEKTEGKKTNQQILIDNINDIGKDLSEKTFSSKVEYLRLSDRLFNDLNQKGEASEKDISRYRELTGQKDISQQKILEQVKDVERQIGEKRAGVALITESTDEKGLQNEARRKGLAALTPKINMSDDVGAGVQQLHTQLAQMAERGRIRQLANNGKIDTNTMNAMLAGIDNKETVGKFSYAVKVFEDAVDRMPGAKKAVPGTQRTSIGPVADFFGVYKVGRPNN